MVALTCWLGWTGEAAAAEGDVSATLVKNIDPTIGLGTFPVNLTDVNGTLLFAVDDNSGTTGLELWRSNGTGPGTTLVKDIFPGPNGSVATATWLNVNGTMFFAATGSTASGSELWRTDGTEPNTVQVAEINTTMNQGSAPTGMTNANGTIIFRATNGASGADNGEEPWKTDSPYTSATMIEDIVMGFPNSGANGFTNFGGTVLFSAFDANGFELWKTVPPYDAASTAIVEDINPTSANSSPSSLTAVGTTLYFQATVSGDAELWKSEPPYDASSTSMVEDINGSGSSAPTNLTNVGGTLLFSATDGTNGRELWRSDGTPAGTEMVQNINAAGADSSPHDLANVNGTLYFGANDGGANNGDELWQSQSPFTSATLVENISAGGASSTPQQLTGVNGTLFFRANDGTNGQEVWKSDGTMSGTDIVADINPGAGVGSLPDRLTRVGTSLFFSADNGSFGRELWKATIEGPPAPTITGPSSPSMDSTPSVVGASSMTTDSLDVFTQSNCQGPEVSGTKLDFEGGGITITVPLNQTSQLSALAYNSAGIPSACSSDFAYTHDDMGPAAPVITGPASPSANAGPFITGTSSLDTLNVSVHTQTACAGPAMSGTKAVFEGVGIGVTVPTNQTTMLSAKAFDAAGNPSPCSANFPYTHMVPVVTPPTTPAPPATKKCKKGQKLKKGKCVKKKRKKKK